MSEIIKLHDEFFIFLKEYRLSNSELKFRLRKTNRGNKLQDGFWFLGTEDYLAIGFWEGLNYKTKVPNISFICGKNGNCHIEVDTSDSKEKTSLVSKFLLNKGRFREIKFYNSKANISITEDSPKECLRVFLRDYWEDINSFILEIQSYTSEEERGFGIIPNLVFQEDLRKIEIYRDENIMLDNQLKRIGPSKIWSFGIRNYGPIKNIEVNEIKNKNQWIFITGENGVGKSCLLKALGMMIGHRSMSSSELTENPNFETFIKVGGSENESADFERRNNVGIRQRKPYTVGFAAYGPMRLQAVNNNLTKTAIKRAKSKAGRFNSLFHNDGFLLSIESEMNAWKEDKKINIQERLQSISELFTEIMLNLDYVDFKEDNEGKISTQFRETDVNGKQLTMVGFEKLSSGYQSIVALVSDMLVRLFEQQPNINEPAELKGVVIIDEIDIHLHPKFQRHLVEQLTLAFPRIQFIASTHSPIPLLGAPKESVFLKVFRSKENGVEIIRLEDKIHIEDLLPNTILTSPIFGMDDITHSENETERPVRTEANYKELRLNDEVDDRLKTYLTQEKEESLITLFEKRRRK